MPSSQSITLLHLSDTQFGPHHRFGGLHLSPPDDSVDTLLTRLLDDLRMLEKEQELQPDVIVLSGDLTESGKPSEFNNCLAFVEGLAQELHLSRDRVVIIPGNHDVNRDACAAYLLQCQADEKEPEPPYWEKWRHYGRFFTRSTTTIHRSPFSKTNPGPSMRYLIST